ncbi:MAG: hypothetical protein OCC49_12025 [Fibrobacterales bacterium]
MPISVYILAILTFIVTLTHCVVDEQELPTITAVPISSSQTTLSSSLNSSSALSIDWVDYFGSSFNTTTSSAATLSSSAPLSSAQTPTLSSSSVIEATPSSSALDTIPRYLGIVADSLWSLNTSFDYIGGKLNSNTLLPSQEASFQDKLHIFLGNMYGLKENISLIQPDATTLHDSTKIDSLVVVMDSISTALLPLLPDSLTFESTP